LLAVVLATVARFAPQGLSLTDEAVRVERRQGPIHFELEKIEQAEPTQLTGVIRTWGAGGFLGAWGYFRCQELGAFRGYLTRSDRMVCLRRRDELPVVVSPDEPEAFAQAVNERIARLSPDRSPAPADA
jgi:hypothetical protein